MRTLGGIVAGALVALATLCAALAVVVFALEPAEAHEQLRRLGLLLPMLGAPYLVYFAVASFVAGRASQPRSALGIGAVVTGAAYGLWLGGGIGFAESVSEVWWTALGSVIVLSATLLFGSEALYWVGRRGRSASEA